MTIPFITPSIFSFLACIYSQTVAKKPVSTFVGYEILLNLTQFLDHVEKPMNNLYPNSGRDRNCSPESPALFSRPRPIREKGVACESMLQARCTLVSRARRFPRWNVWSLLQGFRGPCRNVGSANQI